MSDRLSNYIKTLRDEQATLNLTIDNLKDRIAEINIEITALGKFAAVCKEMDLAGHRERCEDMNQVTPKLMDQRDAMKINLFEEAVDRLGDDLSSGNIRKNMSKLNHYCYNVKAKLWNNIEDFRKDYQDWIENRGHWAALPKKATQDFEGSGRRLKAVLN